MGVKNLWSILSSTGEVIAFGSPGAPVLGSSTSNVSKCCGRDKNSDHLHRNASSNCVLEDLSNLNEKLSEMMVSGSDLPFKDPTGQKGQDIQESLTGSAVAVDLACWVCDSQANVNMHSVIKPHLRNLVFRTLSLLSVGVLPVFVVDGVPPELKQATMQARNAARGNSKTVSRRPPKRHQFNSVLRECCELFQLLGVPWVQAAGEAEATCAALLYTGVVKAVITEDSDVLLYGGCCVLRNFSLQTNKPTAELYTQSKILQKLQLDRHALIALSLLLGCDYLPAGVPGVGVASAVTLVTHWGKQGLDALRQLDKWAHTTCDRDAPVAKFKKSGDVVELEAAIRDRAVRTPGFPFREVVSEFQKLLCVPEELQHDLSWQQPSFNELVTWCQSKLGWEQNYAISKALQFAGRWYVMHALPTSPSPTGFPLQVEKIVRSCKRGGTMCYEVEWRLNNDTRPPLAQLKSLDGGAASASSPVLVTIEPQNLVALCLPAVERAFQELKLEKKAKARKTKSEGRRPAGQAALDGKKESGGGKGSGVKKGSRGSKNRAASAGSGKQLKLTVTSSKTLALCRSPGIYNVDQEIASRSQSDLKENLFTEVDGVPSHKNLPCDQTFADRINVDGPDPRQGSHDAQGLENSSRASCLGWRSSGDSNNASKFYLSPGRLYPSTSSCDFDLSVFEEYDENDDEKDLSLVVDRFIKLNVEERKNQCRSGKQKSSVQASDKSSSNSFSRETQCESSSRDGLKRKMGHNISSPLFSEDGETQSKFHLESTLCSKSSSSRSPFKETEIQLASPDSDHHRLDDSFVVKDSLFYRANFLLKLKAQRIEHGADQLTNGIPSLKCVQECLDCTSGDEEPEKQVCRQRHRLTNGHILSDLPENLVSTSVVDGCEEFEKSSSIDEEVMNIIGTNGCVTSEPKDNLVNTSVVEAPDRSTSFNNEKVNNVMDIEKLSCGTNLDIERSSTEDFQERTKNNSAIHERSSVDLITQNEMHSDFSLVVLDTSRSISDFHSGAPARQFSVSVDLFEESRHNTSLVGENSMETLVRMTDEKEVVARKKFECLDKNLESPNDSSPFKTQLMALNEINYEQYEGKYQTDLSKHHSTPKVSFVRSYTKQSQKDFANTHECLSNPQTTLSKPSVCFDLVNSRWLDSDSFLSSPIDSNPTDRVSTESYFSKEPVQDAHCFNAYSANNCEPPSLEKSSAASKLSEVDRHDCFPDVQNISLSPTADGLKTQPLSVVAFDHALNRLKQTSLSQHSDNHCDIPNENVYPLHRPDNANETIVADEDIESSFSNSWPDAANCYKKSCLNNTPEEAAKIPGTCSSRMFWVKQIEPCTQDCGSMSLSSQLSMQKDTLSPQLSTQKDSLSPQLSTQNDSLSPQLSTQNDSLSPQLSTQKDSLSPQLSTQKDSLSVLLRTQDSFSLSPLLGKSSLADRLKLKFGEKLVDSISRRRNF